MVMNGAAITLEMDREGRALLIGPQPRPRIGHQIVARNIRVYPHQSRMLARLPVNRLARPSRPCREEPAHPRPAARSAMMYHRRAPNLIRSKRYPGLLLRLADRGLKDVL